MIPIIRSELQGSQEWLSLRNRMISATNIAPIMQISPWKTALALYEEKMGIREPEKLNSKMAEGVRLEEDARQFMNRVHKTDFKPVVLQHANIQYLMASLDGMNTKGEILEIKCGQGSHDLAKQDVIPDYYMSQLQCQMFCSNTSEAYYFSYRSDTDNVLLFVDRDDEFIEKMLVAVDIFYRNLLNFTPPTPCDRDFKHMDTKEWRLHSGVWKDTKRQIKLLEAREEALRDELIAMCDGQSSQGNGIRVSKTLTKGRIKYDAIPELKEIDVEKYRGKSVTSYRFTEVN